MISFMLCNCNNFNEAYIKEYSIFQTDSLHGGYIGYHRSSGDSDGLFYDFTSFDNHYIYLNTHPDNHISFEEARSILENMDGVTIKDGFDRTSHIFHLEYTDVLSDEDIFMLTFTFKIEFFFYESIPSSYDCCYPESV